jgi:hypothetical protein
VRESNIGNELKDVAHEMMRFGERCVQAGRNWLNERKDEMNNRNNERGGEYRDDDRNRGRSRQAGRYPQYGGQEPQELSESERARGPSMNRSRGEYYGSAQFGERTQRTGADDEAGGDWNYEGGPERFGTSGYSEGNPRAAGVYQRDYSQRSQGVQQQGRQAYGQGYGYDPYGRPRGYGEDSGHARQQSFGSRSQGDYRQDQFRYGGESAGAGGRAPLAGTHYLDEGEMSGYRGGRERGAQEPGTHGSGRSATEPGQYGYGGYGASRRSFRGVGPRSYTRSDERLTEEINERLTDDDDLDATDITVRVSNCKVTLEGVVDQRWMKHRAEDIADSCSGVKEVDNRITVSSAARDPGASYRTSGTSFHTGAGTSAGTGAPGTQNTPPGSTGTH